jgi:hypothetical protein
MQVFERGEQERVTLVHDHAVDCAEGFALGQFLLRRQVVPRPPSLVGVFAEHVRAQHQHGDVARILQLPPIMGYLAVVMSASIMARVGEIASDQWGLITRRQAERVQIPATTLDRLTAPGGGLIRVAFGVYQLMGTPTPDHLDLRAAWLRLGPDQFVWERSPAQGVVSHRSAASVFGLGHLPADVHEFTVPTRRQTRRPDVRIHVRKIDEQEVVVHGLPVTRASRIASDLLRDREDPEAIAQIVTDAIRGALDYPGEFAATLAPHAIRFGFARDDGLALLRWFLELTAAPDAERWMDEARADVEQTYDPGSKGHLVAS